MAASRSVDITYVPADCGSIYPGKAKAPVAFSKAGIVEKLQSKGVPAVKETHALEEPACFTTVGYAPGTVRNEELNLHVCRRVRQALTGNLHMSTKPPFQLVLGGECSMCPAILSAYWKFAAPKRVGLVYIDADTDLASLSDSDSLGTFAGMNTTNLIRKPGGLPSMGEFSRPAGEPVCDASNMVFFGTNMQNSGNTREHLSYLFQHQYRLIGSSVVANEPEKSAKAALASLTAGQVDVIWVHLDVDAIDSRWFPLAHVPNFTGVRFEHLMCALEVMLADPRVGGLSIAEVNPDHDPTSNMVTALTDEIVSMLGARGN